jgi:hypothetical protein
MPLNIFFLQQSSVGLKIYIDVLFSDLTGQNEARVLSNLVALIKINHCNQNMLDIFLSLEMQNINAWQILSCI